jgi:hypothetical protein
MGERFASFDANRSYLIGAIAQIDKGDPQGAFETLTRCHGDIDPEGLATPMDTQDPDYLRYQGLDRIAMKARDLIGSDPRAARQELVSGLATFGWVDE